MSAAVLVIGNRNYSSWSMRGWLVLRKSGAEFDVRRIPLVTPEFDAEIRNLSPSRKVPVLHHDGRVIWDSMAIAEYVNENFSSGRLWPNDPSARAHARAASCEMHSGFLTLRTEMPMNCKARRHLANGTLDLARDVERIRALWRECRTRFGTLGPWLYGRWSIADAMYAPVVSRFQTYGVFLDGIEAEYSAAVLADSDLQTWVAEAAKETDIIERAEAGR